MLALACMRDKVMGVGYSVSDYEVSIQLLETIHRSVRGLAQSIFYKLLELDSLGWRDIDYKEFGHLLVRIWRHRQRLQAHASDCWWRLRYWRKEQDHIYREQLSGER